MVRDRGGELFVDVFATHAFRYRVTELPDSGRLAVDLRGVREEVEFPPTTGDEVLIDGPVKQNSFSVFGLEELKFERVSIQFGGRVETKVGNGHASEQGNAAAQKSPEQIAAVEDSYTGRYLRPLLDLD